MKLSLTLIAAANASQLDIVINQWWNEAVSVFNFSNNNWDAFSDAINSVSWKIEHK